MREFGELVESRRMRTRRNRAKEFVRGLFGVAIGTCFHKINREEYEYSSTANFGHSAGS